MTIPYLELNHICIIVRDVEEAAKNWRKFIGLDEEDCYSFEMDVPQEDTWLKAINVPAGNGVWIQLIQPMNEKGGMADFLAKRGEGVQHICFTCPDSKLDEVSQRVKEETGFKWIFPEPRGPGRTGNRYQMTHPKYSNGIIIETLNKGWDADWRAHVAKGTRLGGG